MPIMPSNWIPDPAIIMPHWIRLRPSIERAAKVIRTHDIDDLLADVLAGRLFFLPGKETFLLLAWHIFPKLTRMHVILSGSRSLEDGQEGHALFDQALELARVGGADEVMIELRPGVESMAKQQGDFRFNWKLRRSVYTLQLGGDPC